MMRPPISAADLFRAFAAVEPKSDHEKRAVARMLGFDWQQEIAVASREEETQDRRKPPPPTPRPDPPTARRPAHQGLGGQKATTGFRLSPPTTVPRPHLDWLSSARALEDRPMGRPQKPAPLFNPSWTRAILGASLSSRSLTGPPDLDRMIDMIARGQAIKVVPRQPVMTLARGVQALIDIGEGMQPFAEDSTILQRDLRHVVGDGTLDVLEFAGSPRRTRRDTDALDWEDYETSFLAQLDACVLIVSDFGIGRPTGSTERSSLATWIALAARLKRHGHRVVGFIPYPSARWPPSLSRVIELVSWDRSTTVGRVRFSRQWSTNP